jgi:hypothetical protein
MVHQNGGVLLESSYVIPLNVTLVDYSTALHNQVINRSTCSNLSPGFFRASIMNHESGEMVKNTFTCTSCYLCEMERKISSSVHCMYR